MGAYLAGWLFLCRVYDEGTSEPAHATPLVRFLERHDGQLGARRRLTMRNLCKKYAKSMRNQSHTSCPPIAWQFGWLLTWLHGSMGPNSLLFSHRAKCPSFLRNLCSLEKSWFSFYFEAQWAPSPVPGVFLRMAKWAQNGVWVCGTYAETMRTVCENVSSRTPAAWQTHLTVNF